MHEGLAERSLAIRHPLVDIFLAEQLIGPIDGGLGTVSSGPAFVKWSSGSHLTGGIRPNDARMPKAVR